MSDDTPEKMLDRALIAEHAKFLRKTADSFEALASKCTESSSSAFTSLVEMTGGHLVSAVRRITAEMESVCAEIDAGKR